MHDRWLRSHQPGGCLKKSVHDSTVKIRTTERPIGERHQNEFACRNLAAFIVRSRATFDCQARNEFSMSYPAKRTDMTALILPQLARRRPDSLESCPSLKMYSCERLGVHVNGMLARTPHEPIPIFETLHLLVKQSHLVEQFTFRKEGATGAQVTPPKKLAQPTPPFRDDHFFAVRKRTI